MFGPVTQTLDGNMAFDAWVDDVWRQEGESRTKALARLSIETGITPKALHYAYHGSRVRPETAEKLNAAAEGRLSIEKLVTGPTRREVMAGSAPAGPPDTSLDSEPPPEAA